MFLKLKVLDSALYFESKAYARAIKYAPEQLGDILQFLGLIQENLGYNDVALGYYHASIKNCENNNDSVTLADTYICIANFFKRTKNSDSVKAYSAKALAIAANSKNAKGVMEAAMLLSKSMIITTRKRPIYTLKRPLKLKRNYSALKKHASWRT